MFDGNSVEFEMAVQGGYVILVQGLQGLPSTSKNAASLPDEPPLG